MLLYARSDTHFLLYVYDNLRNALLDRGRSLAEGSQRASPVDESTSTSQPSPLEASYALLKEVLSRSEVTALSIYESPSYDAEGGAGVGGWESLLRKWNKSSLVNGPKKDLFLGMHAWRDRVAREEDESIR
jgi:exosome complex exonuclease RRP6